VISSHHMLVGTRLSSALPVAPIPTRTNDPLAVLQAKGVRFDSNGRASADQRLTRWNWRPSQISTSTFWRRNTRWMSDSTSRPTIGT